MTEQKRRDGSRPVEIEEEAGTGTRESVLTTFFRRGEELAHELHQEGQELRARVAQLEEMNAALRGQAAGDRALSNAIQRIDELEQERQALLSKASEATEVSTRTVAERTEIEADLANMANLYIAADQLHSTLNLPRVLRHITELLEQFVGSREHALYYLSATGDTLAPIAAHGLTVTSLPKVATRPTEGPAGSSRAIEQAYLTGAPVFDRDIRACNVDRPVACVPLALDDRTVGVIAVYRLFEQKSALTANDRELFRMLGAHAATAITGALLWQSARGVLPQP